MTTTAEFGPARRLARLPEDRLRVADGIVRAVEADEWYYAEYLLEQLDRPEPTHLEYVAALESEVAELRARLAGGAL